MHMKRVLSVSVILFAVACCLPALEFKNSRSPHDVMWGMNALVVGWSGILAGVMAWYANPFWVLGLILGLLRKPIPAAVAGVVAILISLSTFSVIGQELPGDEGNVTRTTLLRLLPGCYVWMASLVILPFVALFHRSKNSKTPPP